MESMGLPPSEARGREGRGSCRDFSLLQLRNGTSAHSWWSERVTWPAGRAGEERNSQGREGISAASPYLCPAYNAFISVKEIPDTCA